jgi:hypothetical protein
MALVLVLTIVNIKDKQPLSVTKGVYDVDLKLGCRFLHFSSISLVILVGCCSLGVLGDVDVKIVNDIGKEL